MYSTGAYHGQTEGMDSQSHTSLFLKGRQVHKRPYCKSTNRHNVRSDGRHMSCVAAEHTKARSRVNGRIIPPCEKEASKAGRPGKCVMIRFPPGTQMWHHARWHPDLCTPTPSEALDLDAMIRSTAAVTAACRPSNLNFKF